MLVVPYLRSGDDIQFMSPRIIDRECAEFAEVYNTLECDYNDIRKNYIENGILQSATGKFLQNRTKGKGHGSTSRAFYLRPAFMKQTIVFSL